MTSILSIVPEQALRQQTPTEHGCTVESKMGGWPLMPADVSPLAWWRTLPADLYGDDEHILLRAALEDVASCQAPSWVAALRRDLPSAVTLATTLTPIAQITLAVDLAISTVLLAALDGHAVAARALCCVLEHAPVEHPFGQDIAMSWLRQIRNGTSRPIATSRDLVTDLSCQERRP